jgi:predicted RNase H-like HicB family nuclease
VIGGVADANIAFRDLRALLKAMGLTERIRGDHSMFSRDGVEEILSLQPLGPKAKPYPALPMGRRAAKYEVIIYWSDADAAFIAEVPELPGCAADGKTKNEALRNVERIAKEWIETAKELGRTIPKPKGRLLYA